MTATQWIIIGFIGQACFFMRFLIQWIVSEKRGESVIPLQFWYFSIGGSMILLTYSIHKQDPVFILGQSVGSIIYFRNLILIARKNKTLAESIDHD
ncbi:MAG: lipid-A-disaccharide synthase N-terminal domain-containing protein [Nitrospinales bacterium]